jgi:hypothetical protein
MGRVIPAVFVWMTGAFSEGWKGEAIRQNRLSGGFRER